VIRADSHLVAAGNQDRGPKTRFLDQQDRRDARSEAQARVNQALGIDVGALLGGVIVVEQVFGLSGLGQDSVQAIDTGNLPVIIGFVLVASFFVVAANIIVDAAYALLDPRVRIS